MLERWRSQTNLINFLFAALLFLSPWMLGFSYSAAGLNAWGSGLLSASYRCSRCCPIPSGRNGSIWRSVSGFSASPWTLNFPANSAATKVHVMIGLIVSAIAVAELWKEHHAPQLRA